MSHQDVLHGNNLDLLAAVRDNFAHAVVTDPPYGLGFMGKDWDAALPDPRTWSECLRVLRPGGHLVAFGAPRLVHRLTCQIEDAGFEVRDQLLWLFGSGFPKSLDVSKAIDAAAGAVREVVGPGPYAGRGRTDAGTYGAPPKSDAEVITAPATEAARQWSGWGTALKPAYESITLASKPYPQSEERARLVAVLTQLEMQLCWLSHANDAERCSTSSRLGLAGACVSALRDAEALSATRGALCALTGTSQSEWAARSCLSTVTSWRSILEDLSIDTSTCITETGSSQTTTWKTLRCLASEITPRTIILEEIAQPGRWLNASPAASVLSAVCESMRGTRARSALATAISSGLTSYRDADAHSLGPAYEPIVLARKPLDDTVAQTVQRWGTGAINVDGCRVGDDVVTQHGRNGCGFGFASAEPAGRAWVGRWPANLILDEAAGAMLDAQSGVRRSAGDYPSDAERGSDNATSFGGRPGKPYSDSGGASRFFYCPKSSRSEREAGLDHLPPRVVDPSREEDAAARDNPRTGAGRSGEARRNHHATVKPIDLMRWLVRLVTPPGGIVLEPFAGSGTTPAACALEDVDCLAMELDADYVEIARARVAHAVQQREEELAAKIEASRQMDLFAMEACS